MAEEALWEHSSTEPTHRTATVAAFGFLFFCALIFTSIMAMLSELGRDEPYLHALGHNLGYVVATVLVVAGLVLLQRSRTGTTQVRPAALFLLCPAATWVACVVGLGLEVPQVVNLGIMLASVAGAVALFVEGFTDVQWMKAFVGLGLIGFVSAVAVAEVSPAETHLPLFLSLTLVISSSACLYGALIDAEAERARSAFALDHAHSELELTRRETEDLLHDLRNGLLSVEAASILAANDGSGMLQAEIARLRLLTRRSEESSAPFDLAGPLRELSELRRSAGATVDLRVPERVTVTGCESQVMSVLQNLVDNAERHGEGCIRITVEHRGDALVVAVADEGDAISASEAERLFDRGVTSHPDGSGIGLDVARRLACDNGAALTYERTKTGTTSFVLSFGASLIERPASHPRTISHD